MQLLIFVTVTLAVSAPWANASCGLSREEFQTNFCSADAVFKGVPISGTSSLSTDERGSKIAGQTETVNVSQIFRDTKGSLKLNSAADITRLFNYVGDDAKCKNFSIPQSAEGFIIFANRTNVLTVPPCRGVIAPICAPNDIESISCLK